MKSTPTYHKNTLVIASKRLLYSLLFSFCFTTAFAQYGTLDDSFDPGDGANKDINCVVIQDDGKMLIGGEFTSYDGVSMNYIARINVDGSLDTSFDAGTGAEDEVETIAIQSNGKILVGGQFESFDGIEQTGIVRLNTDGSVDTTFECSGIGPSFGSALDIEIDGDGRIMVCGNYSEINNSNRLFISRLTANGALDPSFSPASGPNNQIEKIAFLNSGKMMIGGKFDEYDGTDILRLARINENGTLDTSFDPGESTGTSFSSPVMDIHVNDDGSMLVGGGFLDFDTSIFDYLVKLKSDGSVDPTYEPEDQNANTFFTGPTASVFAIAPIDGGDFIIGGVFGGFADSTVNQICRINSDGSLDESFELGLGTDSIIRDIAIQEDGKIVIVGGFTEYDGIERQKIARIGVDIIPDAVAAIEPNKVFVFPNPANDEIQIHSSGHGTFRILDASGRIIDTRTLSADRESLNIEGLVGGVYFYAFQSDGYIHVGKLVVQR